MAPPRYTFGKKLAAKPLTDLSAYPVLTEEVGFPPSPLSKDGRGSGVAGGAPLGQIVSKAVSDVLGWKVKAGDAKGFVGALSQSFTLIEKEGHIESKWTPRTYAVQTDLAGGVTGAQASIFSRGKVALDQCLPLLDGIYKLDPEAIDEDVAALKAIAKSQLSELVNELGYLGGPRVSRVNQYFLLLLGPGTYVAPTNYPASPIPQLTVTDPDDIEGTLGRMRDLLGLSFTQQDFVNSVEDETNLSNFRIISDYVTSLAQSWLNNVNFVVLNSTTPFFGTQLVLLSRQLSVLAESVDEVRFTLDSVFIGPAERQTMELNFPAASGQPPIFLEDLLSWIRNFATEEGPRLTQDGGKFGVQNTLYPVVSQFSTIVTYLPSLPGLPPGFYTPRVKLSLDDLRDQIQDLKNLSQPITHDITPEPDFGLPLSVQGLQPNSISLSSFTATPLIAMRIRGSGFEFGGAAGVPSVYIAPTGGALTQITTVYFRSESLLVAMLAKSNAPTVGMYDIAVTNPDPTQPQSPRLSGGLTINP